MLENDHYKSDWDPVHYLRQLKDNLFNNSHQGFDSSNKKLIFFILIAILGLWLASGFYIVDQGEQAAVTRFGKFTRVATAGANYHIPFPVESIRKVRVDRIQKEEIGFRSSSPITNNQSQLPLLLKERLMLTGDENIADINFFVQWRISHIEDFLYNLDDVKSTVKSAAESAMREVIGNTSIAEALTHGKAQIQEDAKILLQTIMAEYKSGVVIENLSLLKVAAPVQVIDAFRDVQTARADKKKKINHAEAYRNNIIPKARGEAEQQIQKAQGYKAKIVEEAKDRYTQKSKPHLSLVN